MEAKDIRFKILINNSETQLIKKILLKLILPWIQIQIQIGPKSWIRIQIQCIWIHNTVKHNSNLNWNCNSYNPSWRQSDPDPHIIRSSNVDPNVKILFQVHCSDDRGQGTQCGSQEDCLDNTAPPSNESPCLRHL